MQAAEGELRGDHYGGLFTGLVGVEPNFYAGKDVLDIGCGPRGSLNWAEMARRRVGLDPLAEDYRELGIDSHPMEYVAAAAEEMPFDDASFDVITSFNSLDHVEDLDRTIAEIKRVLRPGGPSGAGRRGRSRAHLVGAADDHVGRVRAVRAGARDRSQPASTNAAATTSTPTRGPAAPSTTATRRRGRAYWSPSSAEPEAAARASSHSRYGVISTSLPSRSRITSGSAHFDRYPALAAAAR